MYKNEEYLKLTPEALVHYIRTKHKKYVNELPEQLEKWTEKRRIEKYPLEPIELYRPTKQLEGDKTLNLTEEQIKQFKEQPVPLNIYPIPDTEKQKLELATKILCSMNTGLATAESVVDHAWEMAELLIKKAKE